MAPYQRKTAKQATAIWIAGERRIRILVVDDDRPLPLDRGRFMQRFNINGSVPIG